MIGLDLTEIAAVVHAVAPVDPPAGPIDGVATDSRAVPAGRPIFVALATGSGDGHDHAAAAVRAGAVAVLAERALPLDVPVVQVDDSWRALRALATHVRERVAPTTVAITGSVGKTTVKDLTYAAVAAGRRTHAARGSYNNELGVPLTALGLQADTEVLVAEIGARHRGDIADLAPIVAPDISVVTAVAAVHLGIFGTIEDIASAKAELVEALPDDGLAVLHLADARVAAMARSAPATLTVATDRPDADVHAREVALDRHARPRAVAVTPWGDVRVEVPLAGRHQLLNALFALAVAGHLGVDLAAAAAAIGTAPVSPWRGAVVEASGVTVLDDAYNANPTAVRAALETLLAIEGAGRRIAVLGWMAELGPTAAEEHAAIGGRCAELGVDHLLVVRSRQDREGEAGHLARGARAAGLAAVTEVADAEEAGAVLAELVRPEDVVLVKASRIAGLERVTETLLAARRPEVDA
ncbi:MAG: UDP-N-acetylmuramoyl-tripeptide--D-alanyl-D-alanine ligase [Nitriliruptoraceae bacterium]